MCDSFHWLYAQRNIKFKCKYLDVNPNEQTELNNKYSETSKTGDTALLQQNWVTDNYEGGMNHQC